MNGRRPGRSRRCPQQGRQGGEVWAPAATQVLLCVGGAELPMTRDGLGWWTTTQPMQHGDRYGYKRPEGGFFLWLDISAHGTDEEVTRRLWREGGLRVIPGHYLARDGADGRNPGMGYIRVALVQDKDTTAEALHRLVAVLG